MPSVLASSIPIILKKSVLLLAGATVIVFRYLSRQILQIAAVVTFVLLFVVLTGRFVQYLAEAVAGEKAPDILVLLMLYRIPEFLLVIVPLAFFLAIILAFGRMYGDNEMVVLMSAGYSQGRLLMNVMGIAALITVFMAVLALYLAPMGLRESEQISLAQEELTEVDLIVAGQFQTFGGGERVTYTERILNSGGGERELANVFVALTPAGQTKIRQESFWLTVHDRKSMKRPGCVSCDLKTYCSMTGRRGREHSEWVSLMLRLSCFLPLLNLMKYWRSLR